MQFLFRRWCLGGPQWNFQRQVILSTRVLPLLLQLLLLYYVVAVFTFLSHLALRDRGADIYVLISSFLTSNTGDAKSDRTRVLSFGRRRRRRRRLTWRRKTCINLEDWIHVSRDLGTRHEELEYRPPSAPWPRLHDRYWHASRRSSYSLICPPGVEVAFNALVHDDMNASNS